LTGLPCCHAISCMKSQDMNINDFVPDCFKKERYAACYSSVIYLANGQCLWERTKYADLQPPPIKRQLGRPKKKRNKDANELLDANQMKRAKWGIKCSRCKQSGHNKSTCKLPQASEGTTGQNPAQPANVPNGTTSDHPLPTPATTPSSSQGRSVQPPQPATAPSSSQRRSVQPPNLPASSSQQQMHYGLTNQSNTRKRKEKQNVSATQPGNPKKKVSATGKGSASSQQ